MLDDILRAFLSEHMKEDYGRNRKEQKEETCIIRESNTGLVDGNDEFYH